MILLLQLLVSAVLGMSLDEIATIFVAQFADS